MIYANAPAQDFQPVIAAFNKQYPFIKVSPADLTDNVVFSKYEAEAAQGARTADLLIASAPASCAIAAISATCWMHYGWSWTNGHAEGWTAALDRLKLEARAAGANRVAERHGAATHVHARGIELQIVYDRKGLGRERLVQLEQIDVVGSEPRAVQRLADGGNRAEPHVARLDAGGRVGKNHSQGANAS